MQISPNLHFQVILQVDLRWPLTLICDFLTTWTYKGSHIILINQVWFKSDFNFTNEAIFTFSAYLTTWPQMTFDLDMWPLTSPTNDGSHVASMNQLWWKSIQACGSYSQMLTRFHNNWQRQTTVNKDPPCVFPAKAGDTKRGLWHHKTILVFAESFMFLYRTLQGLKQSADFRTLFS